MENEGLIDIQIGIEVARSAKGVPGQIAEVFLASRWSKARFGVAAVNSITTWDAASGNTGRADVISENGLSCNTSSVPNLSNAVDLEPSNGSVGNAKRVSAVKVSRSCHSPSAKHILQYAIMEGRGRNSINVISIYGMTSVVIR